MKAGKDQNCVDFFVRAKPVTNLWQVFMGCDGVQATTETVLELRTISNDNKYINEIEFICVKIDLPSVASS